MNKKNILAVALLSTALLSTTAFAQPYLGGTVGRSSFDVNTTGTTNSQTSGTAFSILGGYDVTRHLGVEGSVFSLGKATLAYGSTSGEFKASGVDLSGVARTDAENGWIGFARVGVAYVKADVSGKFERNVGSTSSKTAQLVYGLGVAYQYSDKVCIRGEYSRRKAELKAFNASKTVPTFTVGVLIAL